MFWDHGWSSERKGWTDGWWGCSAVVPDRLQLITCSPAPVGCIELKGSSVISWSSSVAGIIMSVPINEYLTSTLGISQAACRIINIAICEYVDRTYTFCTYCMYMCVCLGGWYVPEDTLLDWFGIGKFRFHFLVGTPAAPASDAVSWKGEWPHVTKDDHVLYNQHLPWRCTIPDASCNLPRLHEGFDWTWESSCYRSLLLLLASF